jgi:hypothetical protein
MKNGIDGIRRAQKSTCDHCPRFHQDAIRFNCQDDMRQMIPKDAANSIYGISFEAIMKHVIAGRKSK